MGFPFKKVLSFAAPFLTTALPGPFGGMALSAINSALGLKEGATVEDLSMSINNGQLTGEQMVALKSAELAFQAQMKTLGIEQVEKLEELAAADRDSARKREIAVRDWTPKALAGAVTVGFFGLLAYMLKWDIPFSNKDIINIMIGSLGTAWAGIITYYFGSSAGSAEKTRLLSQNTPPKDGS